MEVWIPGQVVSPASGDKQHITVQPEAGGEEKKSLPISDLPPLRNPELLLGANDLTTLSYLHEPAGRLKMVPRNFFLMTLCYFY